MEIGKKIWETSEYRSKVQEFKAITDRAVAFTIKTDDTLPMDQRLQIYDLEEAHELEAKNELSIIMVCFNKIMAVKRRIE